jgi:hypothetical protein
VGPCKLVPRDQADVFRRWWSDRGPDPNAENDGSQQHGCDFSEIHLLKYVPLAMVWIITPFRGVCMTKQFLFRPWLEIVPVFTQLRIGTAPRRGFELNRLVTFHDAGLLFPFFSCGRDAELKGCRHRL